MSTHPLPQSETRTLLGFTKTAWKKAGREASTATLGQVGVAVVGICGLRLVTQLADRAVFGEVSLLMGAIALGRNLWMGPLVNVQARFHAEYLHRGQLPAFTELVRRQNLRVTALFAACVLPVFAAWRWYTGGTLHAGLLLSLLLCVLAESGRSVRLNWLVAERRQALVAAWLVTDQVLTLAFSAAGLLAAAKLGNYAPELYVAGQAAGSIATAQIISWKVFPKRVRIPSSDEVVIASEVRAQLASYGTPFAILAVVGWGVSLGDRFALGALMDAGSVGSYVAAYSIASRAVMMPQAVFAAFARTVLFQAEAQNQRARAQRVFVLWAVAVALTGFGIAVTLWLAGPWIASVVLAPRFREGAPALMLWVGCGHAIFGVNTVLENRLLSIGVSHTLVWPSVSGALVNILMCVLLVPSHGAEGAAFAKILAFGINGLMLAMALQTLMRARAKLATSQ